MNIKPTFETSSLNDPTNYYFFENFLNDIEIQKVRNLAKIKEQQVAQVGESVNKEYRDSSIKWIEFQEESSWVYNKIETAMNEANEALYKMIITHLEDSLQYTIYNGKSQHYDWHLDMGGGPSSKRKLSCTIQLSDPSDYEGGDFSIKRNRGEENLPKLKGCCIIFPSYLLHKVSPVTKGKRESLVCWAGGTHFM